MVPTFCIIIWQPFLQKAPTIHYLGMNGEAVWVRALGTITSTQTFNNLYTCNTLVLKKKKNLPTKKNTILFYWLPQLFKTIPMVWHLVWYEWFSTKFLAISGLIWSPTRCKIQHKIRRNSLNKNHISYIVVRPKGFGWSVKDMKVDEPTTDNGCKVIAIAHITIWVKWSKNAMFMRNMTFINELLMMICTMYWVSHRGVLLILAT